MASPVALLAGHPTERLVGQSPAIQAVRLQIRHLVSFDAVGKATVPTLLLSGETGTGKGLVARVVHDSGPRAHGPFIEVNCAAIPETLLEAEVFGFEAGTFTDARRSKPGLFEVASGGTLFLDEIDALPLALQSKFLKAIEEKRVRRLGAVRERPVDIKLIAATQAELSRLVREGRFRPDLYHRLAVLMLALPPLRQRADDILLLAQHYVRQYAEAHGLAPVRLSKAAEDWLRRHDWPGNVRELSHLMERVTLLGPQAVVDAAALERLSLPQPSALTALPAPAVPGPVPLDEPARIAQALRDTGGNVARAARLLGLGRGALRHRMRRYEVQPSSRSRPPAPPAVPAQPATRASAAVSAARPETDCSPSPAAWEQRPVVVLAIDITVPPATLRHTPRYEPWTAALRWGRAIIEKVQGFGGLLVQRSPSLFLVVFGLPHTLDQMPQRAIQAALAVRHLLGEAQRPAAEEPCPEVRLAVHLGLVAVDVEGCDATPRLLAVGDTLALATRLLGHAGAGDIVVSPHVGRLVDGWFELQPRALSLGAEPHDRMVASTVVGLRSQRTPLVLQGGHPLSPFVGRERELRTLLDLLARVEAGHGQVVGIVAEPGMGKSRLLYEFRQRLRGAPLTYLEGHCLAYGSPTPLLPVLDLLRQMWGITPADSAEAITARVHTTLRGCGMEPAAEAPYLLQLLGIRDDMEGLRGLTPEALKLRTFATLRQLSLCSSQRQPLILAVENLHWIDQTSQDFLTSLVENLPHAPILLLTTYRPGYRPPWMEKSYTTQLALPPLSPGDSLRVVSAVFPAGQMPPALTQAILEKADGNPFFLEELAQALVEHGDHASPLGVPDTIQGVLMARIDRLSDGPRRLLQIAAMLDRTVPLGLLRALWEGPGRLDTALLDLQRAEFLVEQTQAHEPVYGFKHVLIQDVVYQSLPASRRTTLHASVGWSTERLYRGQLEEHAEELTHHFFQGEIWDQAFAYAMHSGDKASAIFSNREAVHFYTLALEAAGRMTPPDAARLLALYAQRGQVWSLLTNCDAAVADFEAMLEHARCLGDRHQEGEALCHLAQAHWHQFSEAHIGIAEGYAQAALTLAAETGNEQVRARSLMALALVHQVRGQLRAGDQKLEASLAIVRQKQYTEILPATLVWLGAHANWRGEFQRAITLSLEGAQMAQQVHDGFQELFALSFLCLAYASRGEWDLAFATLHDGMAKARQWDNVFIRARLTNTLGWFYSELGDVARACAYDQEGYELGRAARVSNTELSALINLGFDHLYLEQSDTARRLLEEAFERVEREVFGSHRWRWKIRLCLGLARLWQRAHEPAKALTFLNDGLRLALATGSQKYVAEGRGLRGEILVAAGQRDQGLRELQQGLALAQSLSCPTLTWRLVQLLGRTYERWGDMRQAQELYTTAVADAMAVAERIHDPELHATLLASPQIASLRDDLARLG